MKKRILGIALAICMMIFCVPMGVFAAEAPLFSGGTGTQGDPWLIASQADLTALAEFLNSGNAETFDTENAGVGNCHGYYFKQTADIDLTGVSGNQSVIPEATILRETMMVAGTASQMRFLPEKLTRTVSLRRAFSGGSLSVRSKICM